MFNKSQRLPEKSFRIVMWLLTLLFAMFLLGLERLVIRDLFYIEPVARLEQFESAELKTLKQEALARNQQKDRISKQIDTTQMELSAAQNRYNAAKQSFDNWIQMRNSTQNAAQDPAVIERTQQLDELQTKVLKIEQQIEALMQQRLSLSQENSQEKIDKLVRQAIAAQDSENNRREFKIFAWRVLLVMPILLLAGWLFFKKRKSRHWPFVWGFILFATYTFWVEFVPYVPSYRGYVRYILGLILLLVVGRYGINHMQKYLRTKQQEEQEQRQATQEERRQDLTYEKALGYLEKDVCPSCERGLTKQEDSNFCVHCGLHLYKLCTACQTRNSAFHRFCANCGQAQNTKKEI